MKDIRWVDSGKLFSIAKRDMKAVDVVLDIGCGIKPQQLVTPVVHICCEPFQQYIDVLQKDSAASGDRAYVIVKATWEQAVELFPAKSVDTVFLIDVIEHLPKDEGARLLAKTETLTRRQICIFTPIGFFQQHHPDGKDAWGLDGGAWQEHKSGWTFDDFDNSWVAFASRDFHTTDNQGRILPKPHGAFWAVKTFAETSTRHVPVSWRRRVHRSVNLAFNVGTYSANLMKAVATRLNRTRK